MKKLITFFSLFTFCFSYGQYVDTTLENKLRFGIVISPQYGFRSLESDSLQWVVDIRNENENYGLGFWGGLNFDYKFNYRFSIDAGAVFWNKRYKLFDTDIVAPSQNIYGRMKGYTNYYYIGLPIKINYYITTKKLKLYVSAGVVPGIFLFRQQYTILSYDNGDEDKIRSNRSKDFSKYGYSVLAGFGIDYKLSKTFSFKVQPFFNYSLNTVNGNIIKEKPYSFGLNFGVMIN